VEAHAVLEGIKIARDLVQMPVVVELDSRVAYLLNGVVESTYVTS
jgi:hypothetical protein